MRVDLRTVPYKIPLMDVRIYTTPSGDAPFETWLNGLRDVQGRARIRARLARVQADNLGDCKPLRGGLQELRVDHGPGYRVFLSRQGPVIVLLLCGSDKSDQDKAIKQALVYLADWKSRGEP